MQAAIRVFLKKYDYDKDRIAEAGAAEWGGSSGGGAAIHSRFTPPPSTSREIADLIMANELRDSRVRYPYFPAFKSELSFLESSEEEGGLAPVPVPHIKEIVQVFDELGTFELKAGNTVSQEYRPFALPSSRVGGYIPRSSPSLPLPTPNAPRPTTPIPAPVPVQPPTSSPPNVTPSPSPIPMRPSTPSQQDTTVRGPTGMRTGALEEDLSSLSSQQTLVLLPQPPEQQKQALSTSREDQSQRNEGEKEPPEIPTLSVGSSSPTRLSPSSYLPALPKEFLKTPRAGPPSDTFTLDILVCDFSYCEN